jgi:hypothetical protein
MNMKIPTGFTGFALVLLFALTTPFGNDSAISTGTAFAAEPIVYTNNVSAILVSEWDNESGDSVSGTAAIVKNETNVTTKFLFPEIVQANRTVNWFYENPRKTGLFYQTENNGFGYSNWTTSSKHSDFDASVLTPSTGGREEIVPTGGPSESDLAATTTKVVPRSAQPLQDEAAEIESLRDFNSCVRVVDGVAQIGIVANGHDVPSKVLPDEVIPH